MTDFDIKCSKGLYELNNKHISKHTQNKHTQIFLFTLKALFLLEILNFQIFKCHDVIKYLAMNHETH